MSRGTSHFHVTIESNELTVTVSVVYETKERERDREIERDIL